MKIAFICTGNTARSQIAEALAKYYVKKFNKDIEVFSAGSDPAGVINPYAIKVLEEVGISADGQYSKSINEIPINDIDIFITVCDNAKESCPFIPDAKYIHYPLEDPVKAEENKKLEAFRSVRDKLDNFISNFIQKI